MNQGPISDVTAIDALSADAAGKAAAVAMLRDLVGFGDSFRALRRDAGCSISELSAYVPCDRNSLERIESGEVPHLSFSQWARLARWAYAARHGLLKAA